MSQFKYLNVALLVFSGLTMASSYAATLQPLSDQQLSETTGQALMSLSYLAPTDTTNLEARRAGGDSSVGFYKLGLEATVELNANIKKLQLGCGGSNGSGSCDLDLDNVSFGCIVGASGYCITTATTNPKQPAGLDSNNSISNQVNMKDFVLTNPYFQFAIKNPNSASTREVVGIRIGAEKAEGPLSIGSLNTFSGYFTGKANLTMQGETNVSPVRSNTWNTNAISTPSAFLGLDDATILNIGLASVKYSEITANYSTVSRNGLAVSVIGNRVTQAKIQGLDLSAVVDDIMNGTSTTSALELNTSNSCVRIIGICSGSFGANIGNVTEVLFKKYDSNIYCYEPNISCYNHLHKRFKNNPKIFLSICYLIFLICFVIMGINLNVNKYFFVGFIFIFLQLFLFQKIGRAHV